MPTVIDRSSWPRRHHLAFFETFAQPHFCVTSEVDITAMVGALRVRKLKPFSAMLHAVSRAVNDETAMRLRLRWPDDGAPAEVVLHETVHPSFTARVDQSDADAAAPGCDLPLFGYATARFGPRFAPFAQRVRAASQAMRADPNVADHARHLTDDLFFVSSMPWLKYTSVSHAMLDPRRDSTPRVMWGRFEERAGRVVVGVSVQVHHGLADGGHVARWFSRLSALVAEPQWLSG